MVRRKRLDWRSWAYSGLAGIIGGVATSIVSVAGGQVIGAVPFTPRQLATVAIVSVLINAAMFLKQSPLPPVIEVDEP